MSEVWHKHMYVNDETYVRDPHTNFHSPYKNGKKNIGFQSPTFKSADVFYPQEYVQKSPFTVQVNKEPSRIFQNKNQSNISEYSSCRGGQGEDQGNKSPNNYLSTQHRQDHFSLQNKENVQTPIQTPKRDVSPSKNSQISGTPEPENISKKQQQNLKITIPSRQMTPMYSTTPRSPHSPHKMTPKCPSTPKQQLPGGTSNNKSPQKPQFFNQQTFGSNNKNDNLTPSSNDLRCTNCLNMALIDQKKQQQKNLIEADKKFYNEEGQKKKELELKEKQEIEGQKSLKRLQCDEVNRQIINQKNLQQSNEKQREKDVYAEYMEFQMRKELELQLTHEQQERQRKNDFKKEILQQQKNKSQLKEQQKRSVSPLNDSKIFLSLNEGQKYQEALRAQKKQEWNQEIRKQIELTQQQKQAQKRKQEEENKELQYFHQQMSKETDQQMQQKLKKKQQEQQNIQAQYKQYQTVKEKQKKDQSVERLKEHEAAKQHNQYQKQKEEEVQRARLEKQRNFLKQLSQTALQKKSDTSKSPSYKIGNLTSSRKDTTPSKGNTMRMDTCLSPNSKKYLVCGGCKKSQPKTQMTSNKKYVQKN